MKVERLGVAESCAIWFFGRNNGGLRVTDNGDASRVT